MSFISRNEAYGFAERTRKNLEYIETASNNGEYVHVVTQLINSLLGLIVFPAEHETIKEYMDKIQLDELVKKGWPRFEITMGDCETLGDFVYHLRNAVAHRHIEFSSDSRDASRVAIEIEDYRHRASVPYWRARLEVKDLRTFCIKLIDLIKNATG